ncbi:hypothetical protein EDC01DRAFT_777311 [Geopyxis carbonaria]|nr:hypothetical protein EDC01DRAFT_777311 [Geopyxis carbonaria]
MYLPPKSDLPSAQAEYLLSHSPISPSPSPDLSPSPPQAHRTFQDHHPYRITKQYRSPTVTRAPGFPNTAFEKSEKRKLAHQISEQKRRENIKAAMKALFDAVPDCRDMKSESKATILNKAHKYICKQGYQISTLKALEVENAELRRKLAGVGGSVVQGSTVAPPWPYTRSQL